MYTNIITFKHSCGDDDYLTNTILFIQTKGYITQMEEMPAKQFVYLYKDVFDNKAEGRNLEAFMKAQQTAVVNYVSNSEYDREIFTFINSEGSQLSYNLI